MVRGWLMSCASGVNWAKDSVELLADNNPGLLQLVAFLGALFEHVEEVADMLDDRLGLE